MKRLCELPRFARPRLGFSSESRQRVTRGRAAASTGRAGGLDFGHEQRAPRLVVVRRVHYVFNPSDDGVGLDLLEGSDFSRRPRNRLV